MVLRSLAMRVDLARPLGPGNRTEANALVVTGKAGAGKSSLLARMFRNHPAFKDYGVPRSGCSAVTIGTPSPCNPKALGLEILRVLDYPMSAQRSQPYIFARVRERLETLGILVLHFDEVHNILENANEREIHDIRTMFKTFMVSTSWPVALILSGLPEIVPFFEGLMELDDDGRRHADTKREVRRRGQFVHLRSLSLPNDVAMVAAATRDIASVAGMEVVDGAEHRIVPRLIHAADYELGTTMELAQKAIGEGLETGQRYLGVEQFRAAYRRHTGCADSLNPFVATDWMNVDCTLLLKQSREQAAAALVRGRKV